MANTFKPFSQVDVPASATTVYTVPALTTAMLLSLILSNKTNGSMNVTVTIVRAAGGAVLSLVTNAPVPVGGSLEAIVNKPPVLATGDVVKVAASAATGIDAIGSVLELT